MTTSLTTVGNGALPRLLTPPETTTYSSPAARAANAFSRPSTSTARFPGVPNRQSPGRFAPRIVMRQGSCGDFCPSGVTNVIISPTMSPASSVIGASNPPSFPR